MQIYQLLPPEAAKIALVLFLSFLLGLEREEHELFRRLHVWRGAHVSLVGLIGYSLASFSGSQFCRSPSASWSSAFLLMSYWHKLSGNKPRA